jgi:hypothetical protein
VLVNYLCWHMCILEGIAVTSIKEMGWNCVDWIHLAQDRDQCLGCCEHGDEASDSRKGGAFLD